MSAGGLPKRAPRPGPRPRPWLAVAVVGAAAAGLWWFWTAEPERQEEATVAPVQPAPRPEPAPPAEHQPRRSNAPGGTAGPAAALPRPPATPAAPPARRDRGPSSQDATRFGVRWGTPGLCGDDAGEAAARRQALLDGFVDRSRDGLTIRADPDIAPSVIQAIGALAAAAPRAVYGAAGAGAEPPAIYIYRNLEELRRHACVSAESTAYYDGAIHLAGGPPVDVGELRANIVHEYVHHALVSAGVRAPMWLQEGLAMEAAGERWWMDPRLALLTWAEQGQHLPFSAMVDAFPHSADPEFARAAYFESVVMVRAVAAVRGGRVNELIRALVEARLDPPRAFGWALGAQSDDELEAAWVGAVRGLSAVPEPRAKAPGQN